MPYIVNIPPMKRKHRIVTLAYDDLCLFEFGIATEIFALPRPELNVDWYEFRTCSVMGGPLQTLGGVQLAVNGTLRLLDSADTIIIPGWTPSEAPATLINKLRRAHARGARLVSICSGAFLLGEAGLLANKQATTHWRYIDKMRKQFPETTVVPDVLYVEDTQIFTSAGSAAGIDLCLYLVRLDFGAAIANAVARRLVLPAHRSGGQAQFIQKPMAQDQNPLSGLLDWLVAHLDQTHTVRSIAERAHCSERSLLRRFKQETGVSPMRWLTEQRIDMSKELLEQTTLTMAQIADKTGFRTVETLRHHFRTIVGVSPSTYRAAFAQKTAAER